MGIDLKPLLQLCTILFIIPLHIPLVILFGIINNFGLWNWPFIMLNCAPYIITYLIIKRKQELQYLELIQAKPREWNTEKALKELLLLFPPIEEEENKT